MLYVYSILKLCVVTEEEISHACSVTLEQVRSVQILWLVQVCWLVFHDEHSKCLNVLCLVAVLFIASAVVKSCVSSCRAMQ